MDREPSTPGGGAVAPGGAAAPQSPSGTAPPAALPLGALVGGVAHEMRNPLFGISATLDAFEARHPDREEYAKLFAQIRQELDRLGRLVTDLIDYGRPPAASPGRVRAEAVLQAVLQPCLQAAEKSGVRLSTQVAPHLPHLRADPARLGVALRNTIENGLQQTQPGGLVRVELSLAPEGDAVLCHVLDEGPGLRLDELDRVFEPFFLRRRRGNGLGLAAARVAMLQLGGSISAGTRPEGGARLTLHIPVEEAPAP